MMMMMMMIDDDDDHHHLKGSTERTSHYLCNSTGIFNTILIFALNT